MKKTLGIILAIVAILVAVLMVCSCISILTGGFTPTTQNSVPVYLAIYGIIAIVAAVVAVIGIKMCKDSKK